MDYLRGCKMKINNLESPQQEYLEIHPHNIDQKELNLLIQLNIHSMLMPYLSIHNRCLVNKAKNYLSDQYDVETADYFEELMDAEHDMRSIEHPSIDTENEMPESPPAVGSGFASQAGGGAQ